MMWACVNRTTLAADDWKTGCTVTVAVRPLSPSGPVESLHAYIPTLASVTNAIGAIRAKKRFICNWAAEGRRTKDQKDTQTTTEAPSAAMQKRTRRVCELSQNTGVLLRVERSTFPA